MHRYPDETLNHWADIYVARQVRKHGISLEAFLAYPHQMLARVERAEKGGAVSEPRQHRHERRAQNSLRQRGQLLMQKLWHGSRKRNRADAPLPSRR